MSKRQDRMDTLLKSSKRNRRQSKTISLIVSHFETTQSLAPGYNSSFITLISKVSDPLTLSDYPLISLIGCMYKVVAKLLATKMKMVIGSIKDEFQLDYI